MKNLLAAILILLGSVSAYAQKEMSIYLPPQTKKSLVGIKPESEFVSNRKLPVKEVIREKDLTFVPIHQSDSLYSPHNRPGSYLWADNFLGSVVYTFADEGGISYYYSTSEGQAGTWKGPVQVYDPLDTPYGDAPAVMPQGGIFPGMFNSNPDDAYFTTFSAAVDTMSEDYFGYAYASNLLSQDEPPLPIQGNVSSASGGLHRSIPYAYTICNGCDWGKFIMIVDADIELVDDEYVYTGNLIINKGEYVEGAFDYTETILPALDSGDMINDIKVAFSRSGSTGYILLMSNSGSEPAPYTMFHPILFKTENGGNTWEGPIHCQLGGPEGIENIKEYLSDDEIMELYGSEVNRDSIPYNMGYHADITVCWDDFAHITGIIAPGSLNDSIWYPDSGYMGTFHVFYDEDDWGADLLHKNKTLAGEIGSYQMYNSPFASRAIYGGHTLEFSWIETDLFGVYENIAPDIYTIVCSRGSYDYIYSPVYNVTAFTQAMWSSYFGIQSRFFFHECFSNEITLSIPFIYTECDPLDPTAPTTTWYIDNFRIDGGYSYDCLTGIHENDLNAIEVSQNYPNPFAEKTSINVKIKEDCHLKLDVYNVAGVKIKTINKGHQVHGSYSFTLHAVEFDKGVYLYSVSAGDQFVTRRMIVQ